MQRRIQHSTHDECGCAEISEITFDLLGVLDDDGGDGDDDGLDVGLNDGDDDGDDVDDGDDDGFDVGLNDGDDDGFDVVIDGDDDGDDVGGCVFPNIAQYKTFA